MTVSNKTYNNVVNTLCNLGNNHYQIKIQIHLRITINILTTSLAVVEHLHNGNQVCKTNSSSHHFNQAICRLSHMVAIREEDRGRTKDTITMV